MKEVFVAYRADLLTDGCAFSTKEKLLAYLATQPAGSYFCSMLEVDNPGYGEDWTEVVPVRMETQHQAN